MKVLVVGGGAREHAIGSELAKHELFFAPGNGGTQAIGDNVALAADDVHGLTAWAASHSIDLVVVGPEAALTNGLVDALKAKGIAAFGPGAEEWLRGRGGLRARILAVGG